MRLLALREIPVNGFVDAMDRVKGAEKKQQKKQTVLEKKQFMTRWWAVKIVIECGRWCVESEH